MRLRHTVLPACLLAILLLPVPSAAVLLDPGDGTQNTSAPPGFPYWSHVGQRGGLSAVYVGNGWVLTARHVPAGTIWLDGVSYDYDSGSTVLFENPDQSFPDLRAYRIVTPPAPPLPLLPIASSTPPVNAEYIAIGRGFDRGAETSWKPPTGPPIDGYTWAGSKTMRWGTNLIDQTGLTFTIGQTVTRSMVGDFTPFGSAGSTSDEGIVVSGDSGGGMFVQENGEWVLAGILYARSSFNGQPESTSLYGNETLIVDLAFYRDQIIPLVRPECADEVDNDGDLATDYPDDPECHSAEDLSEGLDCQDGFDNDGDGATDYPNDLGCQDNTSPVEDPACDDGVDNDLDGAIDDADLSCNQPWRDFEDAACEDGVDNDSDGLIDWDGGGVGDPDPQCDWPHRNSELPSGGSCGLGPGLAVVGALLALRHRRRSPGTR